MKRGHIQEIAALAAICCVTLAVVSVRYMVWM
mgnify:CR=1 FL=1